MLQTIVTGGQTGVDRAAMDAALERGFSLEGWCPRGRRAEDGVIPARYPLSETPSEAYHERTAWNVRDSDGTLTISRGDMDTGTTHTLEIARQLGRPVQKVDLTGSVSVSAVLEWISLHNIERLNIAGPRESSAPGIYSDAKRVILDLLDSLSPRPFRREAKP